MQNDFLVDILAFGAHPDDTELACGGTLAKHISFGKKVVVVDLTLGQLSSRGTISLRQEEAQKASKILGLTDRVNLGLADGFFENNAETRLFVIEQIRKFRPKIVLAPALHDRHPDHARAAQLVADACFYSGLHKIETQLEGKEQSHFRPQSVYFCIQDEDIKPHFVIDISAFMDKKMAAILAFKSQFYSPQDEQTHQTPISSADFLHFIEGRNRHFGRMIFKSFGEGFLVQRPIEITSF